MLDLYIDADACPVRAEAFKVAERYRLSVMVVTCGNVRAPRDPRIRQVLVEAGPDAADDWIAEHIGQGDICITNDVPLAARCLQRDAGAIGPTGHVFTATNIGEALARRDLSAFLRETGARTGGPSALTQRDRSRFLQSLDTLVNRIRRHAAGPT
jgi:uncharacterized protein YaiI (UPF0178 family)